MGIDTLQDFRDVTVIAFTIAGTVVFLVSLIFIIVIGILAIRLISTIRNALQNGMMPTLSSFRETANNVRGTSAFVSETAVSPIIRVYSVFAGVKRGMEVITGMRRR
jgi:hypothetical protein